MENRPILLVEDDINDVILCQHAFKEARLPNMLLIVRDGAEAMDYIAGIGKFADRAQYPLPIIIVLDLKMPRVSGFEFLEWLREQPDHERFVVVICSSSNIPGDVDRGYALGAHSFVLKPYTITERTEMWIGFKDWWLRFNQYPEAVAIPHRS